MTIANILNLPNIAFNVAGRAGTADKIIVINQETKEQFEIEGLMNYTSDGLLAIGLDTSADYYAQINEDTTLSIIVLDSDNVPLFRDIVKFSGSLSDNSSEYTFDTSDDNDSEYVMYDDE